MKNKKLPAVRIGGWRGPKWTHIVIERRKSIERGYGDVEEFGWVCEVGSAYSQFQSNIRRQLKMHYKSRYSLSRVWM